MKYDFTVYGRLHLIDGKQGKIRVELVNSMKDVIAKQVINITTVSYTHLYGQEPVLRPWSYRELF